MEIARNIEDLRQKIKTLRSDAGQIAFVPTMGALHEGHLSLIETDRQTGAKVVASIFVNPAQFGPNEDFNHYPRQEKEDSNLLEKSGCSLVYLPITQIMYPENFHTKIAIGKLSEGLCGKFRPGHFEGVATVVAKLFMQVMPDIAIFGEKDFQQLTIIKTLVRDLDFPIKIIGAPTLREPDGLALSSRNAYLNDVERKHATTLYRVMNDIKSKINSGSVEFASLIENGKKEILNAGFASIDYLSICDSESLEELVGKPTKPARILVAARLGKTRLIDNLAI